ncbi:hypothetical protein [Oligoflexus tunisiensis]|uniref:hypothetical protein n=1 Tax=Oligoflexus tunisiensis TaxID=708132 RepID=UPI00114C9BC5|nr:hypothetical protein [Oligoflexus tunisiensis]
MKRWLSTFTVCLLFGCGTRQDEGQRLHSAESERWSRRTGEFEGYEAINRLIENRFLAAAANGKPQFRIEEMGGPGIYEVRTLLGYFDNSSDVSAFRGGGPNPFNAMLWYNQIAVFSKAIGRICLQLPANGKQVVVKGNDGDVTYTLQAKLIGLIPDLCEWKQPDEIMKSKLSELWLQVMSYDAPRAEQEAWLKFFLEGADDFASSQERVSALFETMLMNPFFLLQE